MGVHEVAVVSDLVSSVLRELEGRSVTRVLETTVVVGRLTNLGRDQMEFAYEIVSRGTPLEGSRISIEEEPVRLECGSCGYDGPASDADWGMGADHAVPVLSCPACGGAVRVASGRSCYVKCVDIEEESA
ncbi:MAG: hydrogenase maturation nickel metallochaperone HypA [Candidatus Methanoplasma sp.]|jgi:hydrogenase nickel incorporation protein HypA/HybF|nr:hydrogenase maturation nickel metallochaperone HypA [Candidatus Methanoplasma sp.]